MAAAIQNKTVKQELVSEVKAHAGIIGGFVGLLWLIQIVNAALGGLLVAFGVQPRSIMGLVGILFAPFIHANFAHLMANTVPLAILGWFVMLRRKRELFFVTALAALVGGLGTWLIGPSASVHVGASTLVFGYLGHLLSRGIFERRFWPIVGSVLVFVLYGGALFGLLPGQLGVSWQGHLFGFIGGILAARALRQAPTDADATPRAEEARRVRVGGQRAASPGALATDEDEEIDEALKARRLR